MPDPKEWQREIDEVMTEEEKAREGKGGWIFPSDFPGVVQNLMGCGLRPPIRVTDLTIYVGK